MLLLLVRLVLLSRSHRGRGTGGGRPTMLLHHLQELDDDLRAWADHALTLASLLGVVDGLERIVEDRRLDHAGGLRFSRRELRQEVSTCGHVVSLQEPFERKECPSVQRAHEGSSAHCPPA